MSIIAISRGSFSGGTLVAEGLAQRLGYRVVSREVIGAAAATYGVDEAKLAAALEGAPGLWERFGTERRLNLTLIQSALCDLVEQGAVVYHGHAGHLLLRGIGHVLRVRLIAPLPYRIGAAMEQKALGREAAEEHVRRKDEERARWTRFLYGIDWNSPALYDLVVNLEAVSVESACALIQFTAAQQEFQPTPTSRKAMRDLALQCRVRAHLCANPEIAGAEIEVTADDGTVELSGRARGEEAARQAAEVARLTPGVQRVRRDRLGA